MLCFLPTKYIIAWGFFFLFVCFREREIKCTKYCIHVDYNHLNGSELALLKPGDSCKLISVGTELGMKWKINLTHWSICMLRALYFSGNDKSDWKRCGVCFGFLLVYNIVLIIPLVIHSRQKVFRLLPVQCVVSEVSKRDVNLELHYLPWEALQYILINSCSESYFLGAASYILVSKWETSSDFIAATIKITTQVFFSVCAGRKLLQYAVSSRKLGILFICLL